MMILASEELEASRVTEFILVPIAFWSKPLSGPQLNWITWDQELYSARESTYSWSSWNTGTWNEILPDCLNNLVLKSGETLRQSSKIIRRLGDMGSRIHCRWSFGPGEVNKVGDGCSRDVPERDSLRQLDGEEQPKERANQPTTLQGIFEYAKAHQENRDRTLRGMPWDPVRYDPNALIKQETKELIVWPHRNEMGMRVVECVYVLSVGTDRLISADLPHFAAGEVIFKTLSKVAPIFNPRTLR